MENPNIADTKSAFIEHPKISCKLPKLERKLKNSDSSLCSETKKENFLNKKKCQNNITITHL